MQASPFVATNTPSYWSPLGDQQPFQASPAYGALPAGSTNAQGFQPSSMQTPFSIQGAAMTQQSKEFSPQSAPFVGASAAEMMPASGSAPAVAFSNANGAAVLSTAAREYNPFASPAKLNPFQAQAAKPAQGFTPVSPLKHAQSLPLPVEAESFVPAPPTPSVDLSMKSFVERSNYKRELCKNWLENSFCRFGAKCQYAHG